jgi:hypothetical protein
VDVAAGAGLQGDDEEARMACRAIHERGVWKQECHARAAQGLGQNGRLLRALVHCVQAGAYLETCVDELVSGLPHWGRGLEVHLGLSSGEEERLRPSAPHARSTMVLFGSKVSDALGPAGEKVAESALEKFLMQAWFRLYYGSGDANPEPASGARGLHRAVSRTAFAMEGVRLLAQELPPEPEVVEALVQAWSGAGDFPSGELQLDPTGIRTTTLDLPAELSQMASLHMVGGGYRLLGETPEEDLLIAILEASYAHPSTPASFYLSWLEDSRERVRLTAARHYALTAGRDDTRVQALLESDDAVLKAMVWESLAHGLPAPVAGTFR